MKVPRRTVAVVSLRVGLEADVRGRRIRVLTAVPGRVFIKTVDNGAGQWTAWLTQAEVEGE